MIPNLFGASSRRFTSAFSLRARASKHSARFFPFPRGKGLEVRLPAHPQSSRIESRAVQVNQAALVGRPLPEPSRDYRHFLELTALDRLQLVAIVIGGDERPHL